MRNIIAFLALLFVFTSAQGQTDTMFYHMDYQYKPCHQDQALYYRIFWKDGMYYSVRDYYMNYGSLMEAGMYTDSNLNLKSGMFEYYRKDKSLKSRGAYINGNKAGVWKQYHRSGQISDSAYFKNGLGVKYHYRWNGAGNLIDSTILDMNGKGYSFNLYPNKAIRAYGKVIDGDIKDSLWTWYYPNGKVESNIITGKDAFLVVANFDSLGNQKPRDKMTFIDSMPDFPGGNTARQNYLAANLRYPIYARSHNITGRVVTRFSVETDGTISGMQTVKGIGGGCDEEAIRVIGNMPDWTPGSHAGEPVKVYFTLPFMFSLKD